MRLSCVLIVKNEEEILTHCLDSIKGADEIIVCDTGSTDKTIEIAKKYTDKVFTDYKWNDNFAEARNHAKGKATGDFILSIDADHRLLTPISKVKEIIGKAKKRALSIKSKSGKNWHWRKVIFKNDPDIFWVGKVHENLNILENENVDIERECGYSVNHKKDPERNLKILKSMDKTPRTLFYLGKEYLDLKKYNEAIEAFDAYLKVSTWLPEKAEGYYYRAKCLWYTNRGGEARESCLKALEINVNMKKAHILMAEMSWPKNKKTWLKIAELADNSDVIFI